MLYMSSVIFQNNNAQLYITFVKPPLPLSLSLFSLSLFFTRPSLLFLNALCLHIQR